MFTLKQAFEFPCLPLNVDEHFVSAYRQSGKYWGISVINAFTIKNDLIIDLYVQNGSRTNENYYLGKNLKEEFQASYGPRKPDYRIFIDLVNNKFIMIRPENGKRSKALLKYLSAYHGINFDNSIYIGASGQIITDAFIGTEYGNSEDGIQCVVKWQNGLVQKRKRKIYNEVRAEIDKKMRLIKPVPCDFEEFIDNDVLKECRYSFFSRIGRQRIARCSHCGERFELEKIYVNAWRAGGYRAACGASLAPNNYVFCPGCNSKLVVLAEKILPEFWSERKQAVVLQSLKDKSGYMIRHFQIIRNIKKSKVQKTEFVEFWRQLYMNGSSKIVNYIYGYYKNTNEINWHRFKDIYWKNYGLVGKGFICGSIYNNSSLYFKNIKNEVKKTDIQYSQINKFYKYTSMREYELDDYLSEYLKKPFIEYLLKTGAIKLACDFAKKYTEPPYFEGKSIKTILGISGDDYKLIVRKNLSGKHLRYIQILHEKKATYTYSQLITLVAKEFNKQFLSELLTVTSLTKILNYWDKNGGSHNFLRDWEDTYNNMKKLNIPIKNKGLLFARNFRQTHDNLYKQVIDSTNYENNDKLVAICSAYAEELKYNDNKSGLCVVVPNSINSLIYEGKILGHCVGTYADKIIEKKGIVVFIRKIDKLDIPLYTVELTPRLELRQCCKKGGGNAEDEIKAFLKPWLAALKEKKLQLPAKEAA